MKKMLCVLMGLVMFLAISCSRAESISIFAEENISSRQYGASQGALEKIEMLQDPQILEELQAYFPINEFETEEETMFFYKKYLALIARDGCGYAAATNLVFEKFEGEPEKFEETFGFPMYSVDTEGNVNFNYELFLLKFFNYAILEHNYSKEIVFDSMAKDLADNSLNNYVNSEYYNQKKPNDFYKWSNEELEEWMQYEEEKSSRFHTLYEKWIFSQNHYMDFGTIFDEEYMGLGSFLENYGLKIHYDFFDTITCKELKPGDIVGGDNYALYQTNDDIMVEHIRAHAVYVTDVSEESVIVSSWGLQWKFDDTKTRWISAIRITID
ncbi:MAG: hypothetical protein IJ215_00590 [Clostridia bacterium]|nr:hypothetical protein [Clostridia bacterium]